MANNTNKLKELFVEAYGKNGGNISSACNAIKISRGTYYLWINNDEVFAAKVEEVNERNLDALESVLFQGALEGDTAKLIFMLKSKGRKRGYGDKIELGGIDGEPIKIEWSEFAYNAKNENK